MSETDIALFRQTLDRLDKRLAQNDKRIELIEKFVIQVEAREEERRKIASKLKWFFVTLLSLIAVYISYLSMHK